MGAMSSGQRAARTRAINKAREEERIRKRDWRALLALMQAGHKCRITRDGCVVETDGDPREFDFAAVYRLKEEKAAIEDGEVFRVALPGEYAEIDRKAADEDDARKRARLSRWTAMIAKAAGVEIAEGGLDAVLEAIYSEAMTLIGLYD